MIYCITEIFVRDKSASQVFDWIVNLDQERYLQWHPDHTVYRIEKTTNEYLGSTVYYEQILNGPGANFEWKVIDIEENEHILYKARFIYPIYLSLSMEDIEGGVEVTHSLLLGFVAKGFEKPLDWFVGKFIFTAEAAQASHRHAHEEFKNLERLIE
jgi:hypothetical protein